MDVAERFWSHVDRHGPMHPILKTRCWVWLGSITKNGYGQWNAGNRKIVKAHRAAWFLVHGKWPLPCCLHTCDVRSCVRPDHLFEGTHLENNRDMVAKGRRVTISGEAHVRAKLTKRQVQQIRRRYAAGGASTRMLAKVYMVSKTQLHAILQGKYWANA